MTRTPLGLLVLVLASCATEETPRITLLEPRAQLMRLSVDLRGVHPSQAELAAIEANPELYEEYVDRYLADPRFLERLREVFNLRYLTRNGDNYFDLEEAGLEELSETAVAEALGDEPLRLVSYIAENNLPFTELVLADYTMANPVTAAMWGVDYPEGETGWVPAKYTDGRPHAGILTMTTTWQRYGSMGGNANRHRANAISRLLLCDDYLTRPIVLNRAAVDQLTEDPETAISTNTGCQSCHSTLDPLAAHLFGFFNYDDPENLQDSTTYRPENEEAWRDYAGKEPAYYGIPTNGIPELAVAIADDPRFVSCAARTVFEGFTQRSVEDGDWTEIQLHQNAFELSNLNLKALVRSIVISDEYLAASTTDAELDERLATVKTVSPSQLAGVIEGITGYRWSFSGLDGLTTHGMGLPVLAGGVDGEFVVTPTYEPSVGLVFIQERLAQAAAYAVAEADLDPERTGEARLLKYVTVEDTPESAPDAFDAQIRYLYLAATGEALADEATEPAALMALWKQQYSVDSDAVGAWAGVTSVVLRDPSILFY